MPIAELENYVDLNASNMAIYCKLKRANANVKKMCVSSKLCEQQMEEKHEELRCANEDKETLEKEKESLNLAITKFKR